MNPDFNIKQQKWKSFLAQNNDQPFDLILTGFKEIFTENDLPTVWFPEQYPIQSNVSIWMKELKLNTYPEFYAWSVSEKESFWKKVIDAIPLKLKDPYTSILTPASNPDETIWLKDARFNIIESCFQANPDQIAIYYQAEQSTHIETITYLQLLNKVRRYAAGLSKQGYTAHDRIVLYIPFSIEAIAIYLSLIYIGAEPVLVSDSFSAPELKKRIDIIQAKAVITTDQYWYADKQIHILPKVIEASPAQIILHTSENTTAISIRNNEKDLLLSELIGEDAESFIPYYQSGSDTISILFSSGTTKEPKALPWKATTPVKCAADGRLLQDIHEGDVVTWTSGMGWMMAPWLIFASLLNKVSIAVYGGAYSKKEFIDFTVATKVTVLGTIPSVVKSWRAQNFGPIANWGVRVFSSTGEPSDTDDYLYLLYMNHFKAPIIEYCGGTEVGGGYISSVVELPNVVAHFNTAAPGSSFILLDEKNQVLSSSGSGEVYLIPPSIGLSQQILNKNHFEEYYSNLPDIPGYPLLRRHGDGFHVSTYAGINYYKSIGRTDDSMNLGGIKISAVEIETIINKHPMVVESAAIASQEKNGGPERLVIFIHSKDPAIEISKFQKELQKMIQTELNPLFKISEIILKNNFPRTASNKLMRKELRKEYTK
jgi:acetyl-CoA synthetase